MIYYSFHFQSLRLKKERFNLNDLIFNAISEFKSLIERQQSHKKIVFNANDNLVIKGDKGRILQVLSNLLSNAVKFTEVEDSIVAFMSGTNRKQIFSNKQSNNGCSNKCFSCLMFRKLSSSSKTFFQ